MAKGAVLLAVIEKGATNDLGVGFLVKEQDVFLGLLGA